MSLLAVRDLSLGYESKVIVKDLNFSVEAGDYLCIVGENGSGKSTLMRTLLHLQEPMGGKILAGEGLKQNEIGYLPQQTLVQKDFPASVWEIVLSGCQGRCGRRPFYNREEKSIAKKNMKRMGITKLAARCYRDLSGGQQQRVLLARALCATQKLLLLDEPVSGLDPKVTMEMYKLISSLNREGITIVMISHDISAAVRYASHILHIGSPVFFGTRDEYLKSETGKMFLRQQTEEENELLNPAEARGAQEESELQKPAEACGAQEENELQNPAEARGAQEESELQKPAGSEVQVQQESLSGEGRKKSKRNSGRKVKKGRR